MAKLKNKAARKAVKITARHAVHGTAAKTRRDPLRSGTLLSIGVAIGAAAGWFASRLKSQPAHPTPA